MFRPIRQRHPIVSHRSWLSALILTAICGNAPFALGQLASFELSGTISVNDPSGLLPIDILGGLPFSGLLTYDLAVVDSATPNWPGDSPFYDPDMRRGIYVHEPAESVFDLALNIGEHFFQVPADRKFDVHVTNDLSNLDSLSAFSLSGWVSDMSVRTPLRTMTLTLQDAGAEAFASDALPPVLEAEQFNLREILIAGATLEPVSFQIVATIDSIVPVPEPASLVLSVGIVVSLLYAASRRRRQSRVTTL